jgi:hypothetical protein
MRSKLSAMTARTPSRRVPLAAQSRDEPVPYSLPAKTTSGGLPTGTAWRRHRSTWCRRREVLGHAAFDLGRDPVLDADIGEGAAHHDFVVAATGAVAVELGRLDAVTGQIDAGGRGLLDRTGRRNVVGGDRVAEDGQDAGLDDVLDRSQVHRQAFEIRRVGDIGRAVVPLIGLAAGDLDRLPVLVALEHVLVAFGEHGRGDRLRWMSAISCVGRPDVLQEDVIALLVLADRILGDVDPHRAGDGVGHDQRRRGQIVGLDVRVHAAFEVAVARQDRGRDQGVVVDRLRDRPDPAGPSCRCRWCSRSRPG